MKPFHHSQWRLWIPSFKFMQKTPTTLVRSPKGTLFYVNWKKRMRFKMYFNWRKFVDSSFITLTFVGQYSSHGFETCKSWDKRKLQPLSYCLFKNIQTNLALPSTQINRFKNLFLFRHFLLKVIVGRPEFGILRFEIPNDFFQFYYPNLALLVFLFCLPIELKRKRQSVLATTISDVVTLR